MRGKSRKYAVIIKSCGLYIYIYIYNIYIYIYIYTRFFYGISLKDCLKNVKEGEM